MKSKLKDILSIWAIPASETDKKFCSMIMAGEIDYEITHNGTININDNVKHKTDEDKNLELDFE